MSRAEYLTAAERLRDEPAGGPVIEARRADGVITRFDRTSGAFLAFDPDGTIRTFFKPSDGEAYFRRQLRRR
jgi:pyocin large subunit-like protein